MLNTTKDLVFEFTADCGFTCSDEITLVFTAKLTKKGNPRELPNHGRVVKMGTLFAGYASTSFYKNLMEEVKDDEKMINYVNKSVPHFDARIFNVPNMKEILMNIKWRHNFDCRRNSISSLAAKYFNYKETTSLNSYQKIEKMKEKGILWENEPIWFRHGMFVKLERYDAVVYNRNKKTGELIQSIQKKFRPKSVEKILDNNEQDEIFLTQPFIDCSDPPIDIYPTNLSDQFLEEDNNDENGDKLNNNEEVKNSNDIEVNNDIKENKV